MRWEPLTEAAETLGLGKSTLRSRASRNGWPRKVDRRAASGSDNNTRYLYGVPESREDSTSYEVDRYVSDGILHAVQPGMSDASPPKVPDEVDLGGDAVGEPEVLGEDDTVPAGKPKDPLMRPYVVMDGNYVFSLPSKPRTPWVQSIETIERLVAMYSRDGDNATYNEIARALHWSRRTVQETLRALGKTHDSSPFTDEHILRTSEEDLEEALLRHKDEVVHVKAQRKHWRDTQALADKARSWENFIHEAMSNINVSPPPPMPDWKSNAFHPGQNGRRLTVVSHCSDLHFGKDGWENQIGETMSRDVIHDRLMSTTEDMISKILAFGNPDDVILGAGGDFFHIDNYQGTTTRGTPQDHDGCFSQIYEEGCQLYFDMVEMWRSAFRKVRLVGVRGNHDYYTTSQMMHWLQAKYESSEDVSVGPSQPDRQYIQIGQTLLGMTHGDGVKDKDLGSLMALEQKQIWAQTKYRLWLTGHWHSQQVSENYGVMVEHLPSLAGSDQWHHAHGFVGNRKGLMAHMIDHDDGLFAKIFVDAK